MDFATAICSTQELSLPYDPFQCPSRPKRRDVLVLYMSRVDYAGVNVCAKQLFRTDHE